jgi:hypothetical protein
MFIRISIFNSSHTKEDVAYIRIEDIRSIREYSYQDADLDRDVTICDIQLADNRECQAAMRADDVYALIREAGAA